MKIYGRLNTVVTALLVFGGCVLCCGQSPLDVTTTHGKWSGNLPELVRSVAEQYRLPIVAELEQPLPDALSIPVGTSSARELLSQITASAPGYDFELWGGTVIHFYSKGIVNAPGNFLNLQLDQFTMPRNVSELKVLLPARLNAARHGLQGGGVVTSGFGDPELGNNALSQAELRHVSGRDVLLTAAQETHGFFSIIVFPNRSVLSEVSQDYAFQHWFWGALNGKMNSTPIYVQPPPQRTANRNN